MSQEYQVNDQLVETEVQVDSGQPFALYEVLAKERVRGEQCYICTRRTMQRIQGCKYNRYDVDSIVTVTVAQSEKFKLFSTLHKIPSADVVIHETKDANS
jgi:hypothetical protein